MLCRRAASRGCVTDRSCSANVVSQWALNKLRKDQLHIIDYVSAKASDTPPKA